MFLGVILLILFHFVSFGWNKKKAIKFANFDAISKVTGYKLYPKNNLILFLRVFILTLLILVSSGFGIWYEGSFAEQDYILMIDASGSMMADDFSPTRLDAAKTSAIKFVNFVDSENIGVVSFAGTAFIDQEMTNDKELVKEAINNINIIGVGGTAIGDAIVLGVNTFKISNSDNPRSIILLTDGQSNVGINQEDAIEYSNENGVMIHVLGLGTKEGGSFLEGGFISQVDDKSLQTIAGSTGGNFYLVESLDGLDSAYAEIATKSNSKRFLDPSTYLVLIAFILLLVDWLLSTTRYKTII